MYITDHAVFFLDGKSLKLTGSFLSDCLLKTKMVLARKDRRVELRIENSSPKVLKLSSDSHNFVTAAPIVCYALL